MIMQKIHIEKNTVQETLVIPLYARKMCTERFPSLYRDPKAVELIEHLDYDFSALIEKSKGMMYQFGALEVAMRESDLIIEAKDYLADHPYAAVVNLGCGLAQTAENCDNGTCHIYNIDLPDVIEVRNDILPASGRVTAIAADLNDTSWFDQIDSQNGAVFMAAGVFYYFRKDQIQSLFQAMAERFPGCRLVFDSAGKRAVKIMVKTWVKEAGITSISECFSVDDVKTDLQPWLKNASVSSRGYMTGYNDLKDPSVPFLFRILSKIADKRMKMKIVRIDF